MEVRWYWVGNCRLLEDPYLWVKMEGPGWQADHYSQEGLYYQAQALDWVWVIASTPTSTLMKQLPDLVPLQELLRVDPQFLG
jgi:hypothetical protein